MKKVRFAGIVPHFSNDIMEDVLAMAGMVNIRHRRGTFPLITGEEVSENVRRNTIAALLSLMGAETVYLTTEITVEKDKVLILEHVRKNGIEKVGDVTSMVVARAMLFQRGASTEMIDFLTGCDDRAAIEHDRARS